MRIEMKRIRTVGLCLVAMSALGAVAASGASASELLARVAGGGSVAGVTFLSSVTLPLFITHDKGTLIQCSSATGSGLFLTPTLGDILLRFLGCTTKVETSTFECNTIGAGKGEIHLPLSSTTFHLGLAHLGINNNIPALAFLVLAIKKGELTAIGCPGPSTDFEVKYNVIGALQLAGGSQIPLRTSFSEVNINFQQTANGLQHLTLILMPGTTTLTTYHVEFRSNLNSFILASEVANARFDLFRLSNGTSVNIELVEP